MTQSTTNNNYLERHTHEVPSSASALKWLDLDNNKDPDDPDHYFYAACDSPKSRLEGPSVDAFYTMPFEQYQHIQDASAELHQMFTAATAKVLSDDDLLASFAIPEDLKEKVRESFTNHRQPLAGRLDLAVNGDDIKVYEYNADSASCLYECGSSQGRWAASAGLRVGEDSGANLWPALVSGWKTAGVPAGACLHLMYDDDREEAYHVRYMAAAARAAGLATKLIQGVEGLAWGGQSGTELLDADGERIQYVWKSWSWETVFDDYTLGKKSPSPSLSDVLLSDNVKVWEPLWTTIANNKAILPVLWSMYPNHKFLLESSFELTDSIRSLKNGYVAKPIVGRCGSNVTMVDGTGNEIASLGGKFEKKELVYQEMKALPRSHGRSVLVCPWVVSGMSAGVVLRVDEGLITTVDSPIECLRILPTVEAGETPPPDVCRIDESSRTTQGHEKRCRTTRRHFGTHAQGRLGSVELPKWNICSVTV